MFNQIKRIFNQYRGLSKSIYVIFFARVVTNMGAFIWPMINFIMSNKMGMSPKSIGIFTAFVGMVMIVATYAGGKLADHYNKKKVIIILDTMSVILFICCGFLDPGYPMLALFAAAGTFAMMEWPSFEALFIEASKPDEREKVFSLSYLGMNLGLVIGAMISGFLFQNHLRLAFVLDGLTTFTSTVLIVLFVKSINVEDLKEEERNEYENVEDHQASTVSVLSQRMSVMFMLLIFVVSAFIYDQWSFALPLYLEHLFGAEGAKMYGFIMSFNAFIVVSCTPVLTTLLEKIKELPKVMLGIGSFSLSFLIIMNEPARYVFFLMIFIFTIGEIVNTLGASPYFSRRIPASHRGRVSSYMGIGRGVGGLGGRVIGGFAIDAIGYDPLFILLAILGFASVIVIMNIYVLDKRMFPKLY